MRCLLALAVPVLGLAFVAVQPAAAEKKADKAVEFLVVRIQDLHLTDDQEAKIAAIRKECQPKVQAAAREVAAIAKDEVEKLRGVLTPDQKTKLQSVKEEAKEFRGERLAERIAHLHELDLTPEETAKLMQIRKEFHPKIEKAIKGLEGTLSPEQRKARLDALEAGKKRQEVIAALKLTGDQKEKMEAACKEVRTLVREELEKMRDVLSDGQKEKLDDLKDERRERVRNRHAHMIANARELNLTDDQKQKIAEIRKEFRPKLQEAGNKLRATAREEVEEILKVIKG
jgi:Spy/CpxP family protein refolding chaperone